MNVRFSIKKGDRGYVVYDDGGAFLMAGESPVYIGMMQGSIRSNTWDLLWLYLNQSPLMAIAGTIRNGVLKYGNWFKLPVKACNQSPNWNQMFTVAPSSDKISADYRWLKNSTTTGGQMLLNADNGGRGSFEFVVTTGASCIESFSMVDLIADFGKVS